MIEKNGSAVVPTPRSFCFFFRSALPIQGIVLFPGHHDAGKSVRSVNFLIFGFGKGHEKGRSTVGG